MKLTKAMHRAFAHIRKCCLTHFLLVWRYIQSESIAVKLFTEKIFRILIASQTYAPTSDFLLYATGKDFLFTSKMRDWICHTPSSVFVHLVWRIPLYLLPRTGIASYKRDVKVHINQIRFSKVFRFPTC